MMNILTDTDLVANFKILISNPEYRRKRIAEFGRLVSFNVSTVYRITDDGELEEVRGDTLPDD